MLPRPSFKEVLEEIKPEGDVVFVPLLPSQRVTFLPCSVRHLLGFSVREAAARSTHGPARRRYRTRQ